MGFILDTNLTKESFNDYVTGKKGFIGSLFIDGTKLSFKYDSEKVTILANSQGLITFAKILIDYAWDEHQKYGDHIHLYPSDNISLEDLDPDSNEVLVKKENFDYHLLKNTGVKKDIADSFCGERLAICCCKKKVIIQGKSLTLLNCAKELIEYAFCADQRYFQITYVDNNYMRVYIMRQL